MPAIVDGVPDPGAAAVRGAFIVAGLIALVVESWPLFWLMVAVFLGTALLDGSIRLPGRR